MKNIEITTIQRYNSNISIFFKIEGDDRNYSLQADNLSDATAAENIQYVYDDILSKFDCETTAQTMIQECQLVQFINQWSA